MWRESVHPVGQSERGDTAAVVHQQGKWLSQVHGRPFVREARGYRNMKTVRAAGVRRGITRGVVRVVAFVPIDAELAETFLLESGLFQAQPLTLLRCPHAVCPPRRPSQI